MAITQCATTSFKSEMVQAIHNLAAAGDTIKIALYTSSATLDATTTVYTATNEVTGTNYTAGGNTLSGQVVNTSGTTAYVDFSDTTWAASTITARGAMIYNSSKANRSIIILDFGSDKSSSASSFVITFPSADASNAIIRIS